MKEINKKEIEKLLEIISPAPLLRIGHFADKGTTIPSYLDKFCMEHEYEYLLNCTNEEYLKNIQNRLSFSSASTIKYFPLSRANYMQHGKFYDYLFLDAYVDTQEQTNIIKRSHKVIKNAGLIFIFLPSSDNALLWRYKEILEDNYFVATSDIDLGKNWKVIISKKMHGWGG